MKLQLALDTLTLEECMTLLQETRGSVDIAEVGTPFIIEEGMRPVREFKQHLKPERISLPFWERATMKPFWAL